MRITGGDKKGLPLKTRKGENTRPLTARVKESLFNILAPILPGADFYDFFAGNGGVGIEALSRGAEKAFFIENNATCIRIIEENIRKCGFQDRAKIIRRDALKFPSEITPDPVKPSIVFMGPPYNTGLCEKMLQLFAETGAFHKNALIIAETRKNETMQQQYGTFRLTRTKTYGDTTLRFYQLE